MRLASKSTIAVIVWALPGLAGAVCPEDALPGALQARVDAAVLPLLESYLPEQPMEAEIPTLDLEVAECPIGQSPTATITIDNGTLVASVPDLDVELMHGAVSVGADIIADAQARVTLNLCTSEPITCDVTARLVGARVASDVGASISECSPVLDIMSLDLGVTPYDFDLQVSDCGVNGQLATQAFDAFRVEIFDLLYDTVFDLVDTEVKPLVADALAAVVLPELDLAGMRFSAGLESVEITPEAIHLTVMADIKSLGQTNPCTGPLPAAPMTENTLPPPRPNFAPKLVNVAVSEPIIQRGIRAAWEAGWMCFDSETVGFDLGELLSPIVENVSIRAKVKARQVPTVHLDPNNPLGVGVGLSALRAELDVEVAEDAPVVVAADMTANLFAQVSVDSQRSTITAEPTRLDADTVNITMPDRAFLISANGVDSFVRNEMLPLVATSTAGLPLTSTLFPYSLLAVRLENATVTSSYVQADLDLWPPDPNDANPPITKMRELPRRRIPAFVEVDMLSYDDKTPTEFLRHRIYVDGIAQELTPAGRRITVKDLFPGEHLIRVTAVDLTENEDPNGVLFNVDVDAAAPLVFFRQTVLGVVDGDFVNLSYEARDDRSPDDALTYSYVVSTVGATPGDDRILGTGVPATPGRLVLTDLPEDTLVVARIEATDEAGNTGYAETTFAVNAQHTLDCSTVRPALPWILVASGFFLLRRRRRA